MKWSGDNMEGYKPIPVSDAVYNELIDMVEKANAEPIAQQKPKHPSGCSLVVVVRLPGPTIDRSCGGSCGFWGPFLGRSCGMVGSTTSGGLEISCVCSGGWFDRLFS